MGNGYEVVVGDLKQASDAIERNAEHAGEMASYCEGLADESDAFGELFQNWKEKYDSAAEAQIGVLEKMQKNLKKTAEALLDTGEVYRSEETNVAGTLLDQLEEFGSMPGPGGGEIGKPL